jgi:hypothetical protein
VHGIPPWHDSDLSHGSRTINSRCRGSSRETPAQGNPPPFQGDGGWNKIGFDRTDPCSSVFDFSLFPGEKVNPPLIKSEGVLFLKTLYAAWALARSIT